MSYHLTLYTTHGISKPVFMNQVPTESQHWCHNVLSSPQTTGESLPTAIKSQSAPFNTLYGIQILPTPHQPQLLQCIYSQVYDKCFIIGHVWRLYNSLTFYPNAFNLIITKKLSAIILYHEISFTSHLYAPTQDNFISQ